MVFINEEAGKTVIMNNSFDIKSNKDETELVVMVDGDVLARYPNNLFIAKQLYDFWWQVSMRIDFLRIVVVPQVFRNHDGNYRLESTFACVDKHSSELILFQYRKFNMLPNN